MFVHQGITITKTAIEQKNGVLYLVPDRPRNAPATPNLAEGRSLLELVTRHLPARDKVHASEVREAIGFAPCSLTLFRAMVGGKV